MKNSIAQRAFLWILLCLLLLIQTGLGASFTEIEGRIVMEAEHYDNLRPTPSNGVNWELTTDEPTATSNNEYMFSPVNSHSSNYGNDFNQTVLDNSPRMDYECNFTTGGTYYIWILAKDKGGNSIFFGIDFQINTTNSNQGMEWDNGWLWADQYRPDGNNTAYIDIPTGVHTVNIYQREDGSAIDKIVLATDPDYEPAGFGPNETIDSGPVNNPPSVDAGSLQTILWPLSVQLTGTVTDDDPNELGILTMLWSKSSGPAGEVVFDDETAVSTLASFPSSGTYTLQLQAWDELAQEGSDTVTITVDEPVCPPSDQNSDCIVTIDDLLIVAGKWLDSDAAVNIIGDEKIDLADFAMFASQWLDDWTGSLTVNLYPAQAVSEGALWKVDGGSWKVSGFEQTGLLPGNHTVEFKQLDNWLKPSSQIVQVVKEQMTAVNETYSEIPDATLQISEVMASNFNTSPADGQGEFEDWIEIYNYGTDEIDVGGMYLTDNLNKPTKWQIPDDVPGQTTLADGGYLIIWADNEIDEGSLHAGFSLGADGGELGLYKWDGLTLLDSFEYDKQETDVSCGRNSETDTLVRYYQVPTPGNPNSSPYDGRVADTKFSHDRGFYDADIDVAITCATEGATIRYTLDGSKPTTTNGTIYAGPIAISKGTPGVYDRATTTLRAIAYKSGWLSTNVDTHTYIFLDDVIRQTADISGWPKPSMSLGSGGDAIHDYEMDPAIVDDPAYSPIMIKALTDIPTLSIVADTDDINMSANSGFYWGSTEEPCSIELMYPHDPGKNVQADCGIESHSHNRMKRSMKLSFKTEYGDASFRSSIFQDAPLNGDSAAREVDRFVLRGGNNRCWARGWNPGRTTYTIDQWYRDTQVAMSGFGCRGTFVHLYINGLYWGLYNPTERLDVRFSSTYFGSEPEDWLSVYHGGFQSDETTRDRYNYLTGTLVNKDMTVPANYEEMQEYLDLPYYIDYLLLNWYQGTRDWPGNNWWGGNCNNPAGPFRYYAWDGEWSWYTVRSNNPPTMGQVYAPGQASTSFLNKLKANDDFIMLFADRAYKHMFNNGALTEENSKNRFITLNNFIRDAVVGESARWGDVCEGVNTSYTQPYHATRTRDVDFVFAENEMLGLMTGNVGNFVANLRSNGYYPSIDPPVFLINSTEQHGGYVSSGDTLTMASGNEIQYTLNGEDPRLPGGAINPNASVYGGGIPITETTLVKARAKNGSTWSALHEAPYTLLNVGQSLRVTEIMYHPAEPSPAEITAVGDPTITDENFEFIELKNTGVDPINLNLVNFTNGFEYTFEDSILASGDYVVVVKDPAAFAARYNTSGMNIASGQYIGSLDNEGEKMEVTDAVGAVIQAFRYNDVWYDITDSLGFSLTIKDPASTDPNDWDTKGGWRPSAAVGGSPGWDDSGDVPALGSIKINELLAHSDNAPNDWIELYNTTAQPINIGGWFLSDDADDLTKYEIAAGTTIGAYSYLVFTQDDHFGNAGDSGSHTQFALSENGESVFLHSGMNGQLTGYTEEETFGASEVEVSFGRYQKSTGTYNFVSMSSKTPGEANAYPKVGPIVISEIMYHPDPEGDAEYIELINISGEPVTLYDYTTSEPWKITSGFTYTFPAGAPVTLANNERFLLIKNLTEFTGKYDAPAGQYAVWTSGSLDNGGEQIEISKPGDVNAQMERQYIRIDRVTYDDEDGWPTEPDGPLGNGSSLRRKVNSDYGNDVDNWEAAFPPSPGT